ncbi:MAG: hypothetical protein LBB55_04895 [Zoogloeaceae bacterium]|nr:hypothetical protein [Zoogloeaceae bacterium]
MKKIAINALFVLILLVSNCVTFVLCITPVPGRSVFEEEFDRRYAMKSLEDLRLSWEVYSYLKANNANEALRALQSKMDKNQSMLETCLQDSECKRYIDEKSYREMLSDNPYPSCHSECDPES